MASDDVSDRLALVVRARTVFFSYDERMLEHTHDWSHIEKASRVRTVYDHLHRTQLLRRMTHVPSRRALATAIAIAILLWVGCYCVCVRESQQGVVFVGWVGPSHVPRSAGTAVGLV